MAFNGSNALQVWANLKTKDTNTLNDSYNVSLLEIEKNRKNIYRHSRAFNETATKPRTI